MVINTDVLLLKHKELHVNEKKTMDSAPKERNLKETIILF